MAHYSGQNPGHPAKVNVPSAAAHIQKAQVAGSATPSKGYRNAGKQASTKRGNTALTGSARQNPAYKQGSVRGSTL